VAENLKANDRVEWCTSQGPTRGRVKKKLTERTQIKGQTIAATDQDPRYLVESEKTGEEAAHRGGALREV
jgi:Hypervirulence associated proteins TUDOR domain